MTDKCSESYYTIKSEGFNSKVGSTYIFSGLNPSIEDNVYSRHIKVINEEKCQLTLPWFAHLRTQAQIPLPLVWWQLGSHMSHSEFGKYFLYGLDQKLSIFIFNSI